MKTHKRPTRILAFLLSLCFLLVQLPTAVLAETDAQHTLIIMGAGNHTDSGFAYENNGATYYLKVTCRDTEISTDATPIPDGTEVTFTLTLPATDVAIPDLMIGNGSESFGGDALSLTRTYSRQFSSASPTTFNVNLRFSGSSNPPPAGDTNSTGILDFGREHVQSASCANGTITIQYDNGYSMKITGTAVQNGTFDNSSYSLSNIPNGSDISYEFIIPSYDLSKGEEEPRHVGLSTREISESQTSPVDDHPRTDGNSTFYTQSNMNFNPDRYHYVVEPTWEPTFDPDIEQIGGIIFKWQYTHKDTFAPTKNGSIRLVDILDDAGTSCREARLHPIAEESHTTVEALIEQWSDPTYTDTIWLTGLEPTDRIILHFEAKHGYEFMPDKAAPFPEYYAAQNEQPDPHVTCTKEGDDYSFTITEPFTLTAPFRAQVDLDKATAIQDATIDDIEVTDSEPLKLTIEDAALADVSSVVTETAQSRPVATLDLTLTQGDTRITNFSKKATITLQLDPQVYNADGYEVVREHEGKLDILPAKYENGTLSFETDRFSLYTLIEKWKNKAPDPLPTDPSAAFASAVTIGAVAATAAVVGTVLTFAPVWPMRATVQSSHGATIPDAKLVFADANSGKVIKTVSLAEDGLLNLRLARGNYTVTLTGTADGTPVTASAPLTVGYNTSIHKLVLSARRQVLEIY